MNTSLKAALAAGIFAIGALTGSAATIVVEAATTRGTADHGQMMSHDMTGMMNMMGNMGTGSMMPSASSAPGMDATNPDHGLHHADPSMVTP